MSAITQCMLEGRKHAASSQVRAHLSLAACALRGTRYVSVRVRPAVFPVHAPYVGAVSLRSEFRAAIRSRAEWQSGRGVFLGGRGSPWWRRRSAGGAQSGVLHGQPAAGPCLIARGPRQPGCLLPQLLS